MLLRLQTYLCVLSVLCLQCCTPSPHDERAVDWDRIDYAKIACGKGKSTQPGCKFDEEAIDVGRRGGKGK